TIELRPAWIGARVVYVVDQRSLTPIILGVVREPGTEMARMTSTPSTLDVSVDDDRICLSASREIVLQCGDASITLTRSGRVLIKGAYVLSRASGYNK